MTPEQLDDIRHDRASMGSERTIAALLAEVDRLLARVAVLEDFRPAPFPPEPDDIDEAPLRGLAQVLIDGWSE